MKNIIVPDETLEHLENLYPDLVSSMVGKGEDTEVLVVSILEGSVVEIEYWLIDPDFDFPFTKNAIQGTLKDILEATNAIN